jgi:arsenate reductase (thioredoxin)
MSQDQVIVFVCEHGAAKSVIAAAYFNKLASEKNLDVHAIARGTHPDSELSPKAIVGLQTDGLTPSEETPQKLSRTEVESARQIVSFCELPEEYQTRASIEKWDDIPPVSESYEIARDAILEKMNQLMK